MNSVVFYCKKFQVPFQRKTITPNYSYSSRVKDILYNLINIDNLILVDRLTKLKHFAILRIRNEEENDFTYLYSDTFDQVFKNLNKIQRINFLDNYKLTTSSHMNKLIFIMTVKTDEFEYVIRDWGIIVHKNIKYESN